METISAAGSSASASSGPWSSGSVWFDRTQRANFGFALQTPKAPRKQIFAAHGVTAFGAAAVTPIPVEEPVERHAPLFAEFGGGDARLHPNSTLLGSLAMSG